MGGNVRELGYDLPDGGYQGPNILERCHQIILYGDALGPTQIPQPKSGGDDRSGIPRAVDRKQGSSRGVWGQGWVEQPGNQSGMRSQKDQNVGHRLRLKTC